MNRRERKKEETRLNIIDCSIELFRAKGFHETSMEEIAEKADVSKGTLYNYFENKESILIAYVQSTIVNYGQEMKSILNDPQGIREKLRLLLDFRHDLFGKDLELTAIYTSYRMQSLFSSATANPFINPHRSGLENLILEIIVDAQKNKELRNDIPALVLARSFQLNTLNYFLSCQYSTEVFQQEQLREQLIDIFLEGTMA